MLKIYSILLLSLNLLFAIEPIPLKINQNEYIFINNDGTLLFNDKEKFSYASEFKENIAVVSKNNLENFYYINKNGEKLFNKRYKIAYEFYNKLAIVSDDGYNFYYINKNGEKISKYYYKLRNNTHKNIKIASTKDLSCLFLNEHEDEIFSSNLFYCYEFNDNFSRILDTNSNLYSYINTKGDIISEQFLEANDFYGGYASVKTTRGWGLINSKMEFVIKPQYQEMDYRISENNIIGAKKGDWWGFVDLENKEKIPFEYSNVYPFINSGTTPAQHKNGNWGLIDYKGNWLIKPIYNDSLPFIQDIAIFKDDFNQILINRHGEIIKLKLF